MRPAGHGTQWAIEPRETIQDVVGTIVFVRCFLFFFRMRRKCPGMIQFYKNKTTLTLSKDFEPRLINILKERRDEFQNIEVL